MKLALLFPGQGPELMGLGGEFMDRAGSARRLFELAEQRLETDLRNALASGPPRLLARCRIAQPLIFVMACANADWLVERGVRPALVAGHSLGQFAAIATSGAVAPDTMLELVVERGRLMDQSASQGLGRMLAVDGASRSIVEAIIEDAGVEAWISNDNAPDAMRGVGMSIGRFDQCRNAFSVTERPAAGSISMYLHTRR